MTHVLLALLVVVAVLVVTGLVAFAAGSVIVGIARGVRQLGRLVRRA